MFVQGCVNLREEAAMRDHATVYDNRLTKRTIGNGSNPMRQNSRTLIESETTTAFIFLHMCDIAVFLWAN